MVEELVSIIIPVYNVEKFLNECKEYLRERNKTTKIIATGIGSYEFII